MKKIIYILITFLIVSATGCSDYLDITPSGQRDENMVWTTKADVEQMVVSMYAQIPQSNLHQEEPWVGLSDECDLTWTVYSTYNKNFGAWSESENFWNKYGVFYKGIRKTLEMEANIDRCIEMPVEDRERTKNEAKFLRGYYYWLLLRQYGPVVLVKEVLDYQNDFSTYQRATYDECVDYIVELMDDAEKGLPLYWSNTTHYGRPNKIVCKSLKSIVLHHAASPQFNGGEEIKAEYSNFRNPDGGVQLISTTYDESKWKRAAEAAKEVIDIADANPEILGLYSDVGDINATNHNPYKSYVRMFLGSWNKEMIWGRLHRPTRFGWMVHIHPGPKELGGVGPTQRLVDAFLMEDGRPIEESDLYVETGWATTPGKNWNPNGHDVTGPDAGRIGIINDSRSCIAWGHWAGDWNMYANREPRFYASILYNKALILPEPTSAEIRNRFNTGTQKNGFGRAELYYGGASRQSGSYTFYSRTGYLTKKKMDPMAAMGNNREMTDQYPDIFIRYANIILNYIEALNEYDPSNPNIKKYWDMIRTRAGVPGVFETSLKNNVGNKELQREFIIRERQIELNMEGDRYFTTRRRLLAHQQDTKNPGKEKFGDGGPMYGMDVNAGDPSSNTFEYEGFYKRTIFETRVFDKRFYLFPIPKNEVDKSEGQLVQNPGWR